MEKYNFENTQKVNDELKRIEKTINKLILDRDKSDRIKGITFGLSTYLALTNIIDIESMNFNQSLIRNLVLMTSTLLYIKYKEIGDQKTINILGLKIIKDELEENISEKQKTIQNKK